jgi:hypothetical protein
MPEERTNTKTQSPVFINRYSLLETSHMANRWKILTAVAALGAAGAAMAMNGLESAVIQNTPATDFLVNDDSLGGCSQAFPVISGDVDYFDVIFQRFDSSGASLGGNETANDDSLGAAGRMTCTASGTIPAGVYWESTKRRTTTRESRRPISPVKNKPPGLQDTGAFTFPMRRWSATSVMLPGVKYHGYFTPNNSSIPTLIFADPSSIFL